MFLGSKVRLVSGTDNLSAICESSRPCGILNISQPYGPPRPVTGIALLCTFSLYESEFFLILQTLISVFFNRSSCYEISFNSET
jgi:hypothetical protein